jgi:hypothetical protein
MEAVECTCTPGRKSAEHWVDECSGCRCWWDWQAMLHALLGGWLHEWPIFEYPRDAGPAFTPSGADSDHPKVRLYHRLAAAAAAQKAGEIALTDDQVHAFHEALGQRPLAQAERARIVEAVIPHCLAPMDDAAFQIAGRVGPRAEAHTRRADGQGADPVNVTDAAATRRGAGALARVSASTGSRRCNGPQHAVALNDLAAGQRMRPHALEDLR